MFDLLKICYFKLLFSTACFHAVQGKIANKLVFNFKACSNMPSNEEDIYYALLVYI